GGDGVGGGGGHGGNFTQALIEEVSAGPSTSPLLKVAAIPGCSPRAPLRGYAQDERASTPVSGQCSPTKTAATVARSQLFVVSSGSGSGRLGRRFLAIHVVGDPPLLAEADQAVHRVVQAQARGEEGEHHREQQRHH